MVRIKFQRVNLLRSTWASEMLLQRCVRMRFLRFLLSSCLEVQQNQRMLLEMMAWALWEGGGWACGASRTLSEFLRCLGLLFKSPKERCGAARVTARGGQKDLNARISAPVSAYETFKNGSCAPRDQKLFNGDANWQRKDQEEPHIGFIFVFVICIMAPCLGWIP